MFLAYLDPGSGSALLGTLFALVGALAYSLKSIFYRFVLGKKTEKVRAQENLAIFSEGKSYWGTFRPIVEELLKRGIAFSYYTLDIDDPALTIDSPLMYSRLFDKDKFASFKKVEAIKARVLLATTPNIGCVGYPLQRPKKVQKLVHVFHDPLGDLSTYRKGSLDFYDEVLTVSPQNEALIRSLEQKRETRQKKLVLAGAPYLDDYVMSLTDGGKQAFDCGDSLIKPTVLVAVSWGDKNLLRVHGYQFIKELIAAGIHVIVRPHPQSYNSERVFIEKCEHEVKSWGGEWDCDRDGTKSMRRAQVMISDVSGVRIDYAYLFERPVVSVKIPKVSVKDFEADDLGETWTDRIAVGIGVELIDTSGIVSEVKRQLSGKTIDIKSFRDENCANFGHAAQVVVDYLAKDAGK